jgi:hypothetical protein
MIFTIFAIAQLIFDVLLWFLIDHIIKGFRREIDELQEADNENNK